MSTGIAEDERRSEVSIVIRQIQLDDCDAVAKLSGELGYPAESATIRQRIEELLVSNDRITYVAAIGEAVVGWIEVAIAHHLATGTHGEITGLIISTEYRSKGLGRKLLIEAERWIANQGISQMIVRSRVSREAAHRFYIREGYTLIKTSAVFSKTFKTTKREKMEM